MLLRPRLVTLISFLYVLGFCFTVLSVAFVLRRFGPPDYGEFRLWRAAMRIPATLMSPIAAIRLFRMRKDAVLLFGLSLVLNLILMVYPLISGTWRPLTSGVALAYTIGELVATFGWLVTVPVYLYARKLRTEGKLY